MTEIGQVIAPASKNADICDSRKFVSKPVYAVTWPNQPMYEVGAWPL